MQNRPEKASDSPGRIIRVAIVGLGSIGKVLAKKITSGEIPGVELVAISARDPSKARSILAELSCNVPILSFDELPDVADIAIECAPAELLSDIVRPMLDAGKTVMVLSAGALLNRPELIELARKTGGQIIVPTGALLGLDAVSAAAEGKIISVSMITRKPIAGLLGAPYLTENNISIENATTPVKVFEGTARQAAIGFPANLNVAAALALAGIGADRTTQEIWADPQVTRNTHTIIVEADSARFEMKIENIPSENPKTGRITALSVLAALRKISGPLRVST
jgi:aspartate dehydrogenase